MPPGIASCRFVVCDRKIELWYKVYEWCRETISRLLPFVLVAYFNSKILITYRNTKKERFQRLASNQQKISTKSEQVSCIICANSFISIQIKNANSFFHS